MKGFSMKIVRIVLAASLLLSLRSTLFASSAKTSESSHESIQLERKVSFDAARDGGPLNGWFGWTPDALADYTLKNLKKDYQGKEIRPGKCPKALAIWEKFGKEKVNDLETAELYTTAIAYSQLSLSQQAQQKSQSLIEAESQRLQAIKQAKKAEMHAINQEAINTLAMYHARHELESAEDAELLAEHAKRLTITNMSCAIILKQKQEKLAHVRAQEKAKLADTLQQYYNHISTIEAEEKMRCSEKFVITEKSITKAKIVNLAKKYKNGKPKLTTFADVTLGEK